MLNILLTVDRTWRRFPLGETIPVAVRVCHRMKILRVSPTSLSHSSVTVIESDLDHFAAHMDVQWTVVFSGLSAGRVELLDQFAQSPILAHNATQAERVLSHSLWEQTRKLNLRTAFDRCL